MPWGAAEYTFEVHTNSGGPTGVDCGILALREAMRRALGSEGCFADTAKKIREDMVQMFLGLGAAEQVLMANQYLQSADCHTPPEELRTKTIQQLRTRTLNWHTLVQYVQWRFPGRVNAVIWKQPPRGNVFQYEGGTNIDPNLPILHIAHYNSIHFEALTPVQGDAVARAIKGRVDNAVEYITSNYRDEIVPLLVAPHPAKAGSMLLQFGDSPTVYECERGDAAMRSVGAMTPSRRGVSHWFDYSEARPVPPSVVSGLEEFLLIQGFSQMEMV